MQSSNFWPYFIFGIVVIHFIVGIGFLVYKMSPKNNEEKAKTNDED